MTTIELDDVTYLEFIDLMEKRGMITKEYAEYCRQKYLPEISPSNS